MISYDICFCMSEECPKYKECYRGGGSNRPPGVYTMSILYPHCEKNNYEDFIPSEEGNR